MVIGAGPHRCAVHRRLVARGIGPVIAVEPGERRKQLARQLGASEVLDPADLETFRRGAGKDHGRAVHVVLECSGKKEAIEAGFHQLGRGGTLVLVGAGLEHPAFDPNRFVLNELHVVGSFVYDQGGLRAGPRSAGFRPLPHRHADRVGGRTPGPAVRALTGLAEGRLAGKVMVVPHLSGTAGTEGT